MLLLSGFFDDHFCSTYKNTIHPTQSIEHVCLVFVGVRSKSLTNVKGAGNVLVPEVGTASYHVALASGSGEAAADDLYMEGISLRRGFAAEFIAHLEVE